MADRLAVVTGTSSGIGAALAGELLARGWTVLGIARSAVERPEPGYRHVRFDLSDVAAFEDGLAPRLEAAVAETPWARVGLVNNAAGLGQFLTLDRLDPAALLDEVALNVVTPMALMGVLLRACPRGTPLRIVNVSSGAALHPIPGLADYCASKAALRMAGMVLGSELGPLERPEVAVLSYEPGTVATDMQDQARAQSKEDFPAVDMFREFKQSGRLAEPARVVVPVADFLEGDGDAGFSEARFEGTA